MSSIMEIQDASHPGSVLEKLNEQRLQGLFCDVTVVVEDTKFKAHKNVLAASSTYFKTALSRRDSTFPDPILELPDVPAEVFANIVNFIYNSRVTVLGSDLAKEVAAVGKQLGICCLENYGDVRLAQRAQTSSHKESSKAHVTGVASNARGTKEGSQCVPVIENQEESLAQGAASNTKTLSVPLLSLVSNPALNHMPESIGRQTELDKTASPLFLQSTSLQQVPTQNCSLTLSPISLPVQGQGTLSVGNQVEILPFPATQTTDNGTHGSAVDPEVETTETARILYTLSTVRARSGSTSDTEQDQLLKDNSSWETEEATGPDVSLDTFPQTLFRCAICRRPFSSSTALSLHVKLHRSRKTFSCSYCNKSFIHIKRLQAHEVQCKQTNSLPSEDVGAADMEGTDSTEVPQSSDLSGHQSANHLPAKKGHAGLLFRHRSFQRIELGTEQDHFMKVVDGHIIYFCSICERSYMTLSSLKRHSNVHSWRRRYPCHYCEKVFALAEYRTKHEVWHTGERRYQCIFCWETFVTYYNLKTHQKAFHGINPGLIASEKTPNGGYKPKVNALKLYRLLPMRSEKRPYKTYSQSFSGSLLMPSQSLPMASGKSDSLDSSIAKVVGSTDSNVSSAVGLTPALGMPETEAHLLQSDFPPPLQDGQQGSKGSQESMVTGCSMGELQTEKSLLSALEMPLEVQGTAPKLASKEGCSNGTIPSVIAYGHPTPSVIVCSASVPSPVAASTQGPSVITYSSKSSSKGPAHLPMAVLPAAVRQVKKRFLKEAKPAKLPLVSTDQSSEDTESGEEETDSDHSPIHSKGKTMTYTAKPAYVGNTSESRNAPLCQITVRIGEEAIVKRRISETDLMRDKSPTKKKKRLNSIHARGEKPARDGERKTSSSWGRETCDDDDSDRDGEDQLWRPYYSYKPKRKSCNVQKVKKSRWRKKLRYKRSLKWRKRAEREANVPCNVEDSSNLAESENETPGHESTEPVPSSKPNDLKHHRSSRASEWKYECTTCGKRFSALKKFGKHEKTHRDTAVYPCGLCMQEFPTHQLAVEHQETHSSEFEEHTLSPKQDLTSCSEQVSSFKLSSTRVGRKPLVKHNCLHCTKVCKTAAALSRHIKRHEVERPRILDADGEEASQEREEVQGDSLEPPSPASVIAFSKSNDQGSNSPKLQEATGEEPTAKNLEDVLNSPTLQTIKEEDPQEMHVSSSSGEATMTREAELSPPYLSPVVGSVHSVNSPNDPVPHRLTPFALEDPSASPSMPLNGILSSGKERGTNRDTQKAMEVCCSTDIPNGGFCKDQLLTCLHADVLTVRDQQLPSPSYQQEKVRPQGGITQGRAMELLHEDEIQLPLVDGARVISPQHDLTHPCADDAYLQEKKAFPHTHGMPSHKRTPEASLSITSHKEYLQSSQDISLQDPLIAHTDVRRGLSLVQQHLPSKIAGEFQESLRHNICLEPRFPVQEYPLPLLTPGGWRARKEMEENTLLSYGSPLPFNAMSKVAGEAASKMTFFPDPYPLMYGHQLLAYPYSFTNLAALPVALNMVIPDDKGQPLPFLPSMFGYSVNPCRSEVQEAPVLMNSGPTHGRGSASSHERPKRGRII
ncbi:zinc finger and BTB domain-containing protein 4-like [Ambystoma mexicanum]|uniref:zinc finger and BTB domain-containing protein 4-like n=1 Tax=Ambystoma mexicanum TaxID=8296 RepID=UPI0037E80C6C